MAFLEEGFCAQMQSCAHEVSGTDECVLTLSLDIGIDQWPHGEAIRMDATTNAIDAKMAGEEIKSQHADPHRLPRGNSLLHLPITAFHCLPTIV